MLTADEVRELDKCLKPWNYPYDNLLNGLRGNARIYHLIPLQHFRELLKTSQLTLARPRSWQDKWEDVLAKARGEANKFSFGYGLTNNVYAHCWSLEKECEAKWRLAAAKKSPAVRISTTAGKLIEAVWQRDRFCHHQRFLGKVKYLPEARIMDWFKGNHDPSHPLMDQSGRGIAGSLLFKRRPFRYEREVRLLVADHTQEHGKEAELKRVSIDPPSLIDEIMMPPSITSKAAINLESELRSAGFSTHQIVRSTLNQTCKFIFVDGEAVIQRE